MRVEFDDGTLLLRDAPDEAPYAEWDDRVGEYRAQAYRYRALLEWAGTWTDGNEQATLRTALSILSKTPLKPIRNSSSRLLSISNRGIISRPPSMRGSTTC